MRLNDEAKLQVVHEAHGEAGELIAALYEVLPGVMAHHFLTYSFWTQMELIGRLREVLNKHTLTEAERRLP